MKFLFLQINETRYYFRLKKNRYLVYSVECLVDGGESEMTLEYAHRDLNKIFEYFEEDFEDYEILEVLEEE